MIPVISVDESKALFALLDAAVDGGLLVRSPIEARWRESRDRVSSASCEMESGLMWDLMRQAEQSGAIENTWILERWRMIQKQVGRSSSLIDETRHTPPLFARRYRN